jgi:uncharacterized protein with PIN domain
MKKRLAVFVDASAIVAILTEEDEAQDLADALDQAKDPISSPIAVWEAAAFAAERKLPLLYKGKDFSLTDVQLHAQAPDE